MIFGGSGERTATKLKDIVVNEKQLFTFDLQDHTQKYGAATLNSDVSLTSKIEILSGGIYFNCSLCCIKLKFYDLLTTRETKSWSSQKFGQPCTVGGIRSKIL